MPNFCASRPYIYNRELWPLWTDRALSFSRLLGAKREEAEREFEKTTMAFFVIRESDALSCALDISIVTDGVEVLDELLSVACACAIMFGHIYALNLKYPEGLKYTFEAFQK
ncbi:Hydroxyethylthiazole kinase [Labeo rohita]|uniref:Hydroxyethylthiazole kinase n=1 Tax=Labeo rohita TaxID=84645 RepID=A0ABQ8LXT9_LABRO|nr:Hydroxyethylthiazole kinase [Labeo rohita]